MQNIYLPGVSFKFTGNVVYKPDSAKIQFEHEIKKEDNRIFVRLLIENKGEDASLIKASPVVINQDLLIGSSGARDWILYTSGRHKNDIPSACDLNIKNEAFFDCLNNQSEAVSKAADTGSNPENQYIFHSDVLTVIQNKKDKAVLLIGYPGGSSQLVQNSFFIDRETGNFAGLESACEFDGITLAGGKKIHTEWVMFETGNDPFELIENFSLLKRRELNAAQKFSQPSVYCTWYYYGASITSDDILNELEYLTKRKVPVDVFQIDAGWEIAYGEWEANYKFNERSSRTMKYYADQIKESGLKAGIWTAPFTIAPNSYIFFYEPHWLLKRKNGEYTTFKMGPVIYYVLDISHPEVLEYLKKLYTKITCEWGFTYHKLDFTRCTIINNDNDYFNKTLTRAQIYRNAIRTIREAIGEDSYFLLCGGLYCPAAGYADAQRTGSDVLAVWSQKESRIKGKYLPFTVKQNVLRYWMSSLWHNDPDALMLRRNTITKRNLALSLGLLNDNEVNIALLSHYFGGGLISFTDPIKEIDEDRLLLLRRVIPQANPAAIPIDLFNGNKYPRRFLTCFNGCNTGNYNTLSIINWEETEAECKVILNETVLKNITADQYCVSEFFTGRIFADVKAGDVLSFGKLLPHSAFHIKINPIKKDTPIIALTDGHYSMGNAEVKNFIYNKNELSFSVKWQWNCNLTITLLAPAGKVWEENNANLLKVNIGPNMETTIIRSLA
ncbi:MAG: alpha-galactosidase [Treponema sp.]|nr:alpha-galactosidase [Treponema sp.]